MRTQEIGTSARSSCASPIVQIARASLPSTELTVVEQPPGKSGADNCAGNVQDSAAGKDSGRESDEPLEDEGRTNHSNSKDFAQHDAIVHDCHGNNGRGNQLSQATTKPPSGKVRGTAFKTTSSGPQKVSNFIYWLANLIICVAPCECNAQAQ